MTATGVFDALDAFEGIEDPDPFVLLDAAIERVSALDPSASNDTALAGDVVWSRRRMDRVDAIAAEWTLAAHRRGVCSVDGYRFTASWLGWKIGVYAGQVRRTINTAEVAELLPETGAAWRDGKISTPAMEAIASARVAGHDEKLAAVETEFLDLAKRGDHASVRRLAACFRDAARADGTKPAEPNGLTMAKLLDGCTSVHMELCDLDAETLSSVIDMFMDPPSDPDGRTAAQRRRDALMRACRVAAGCGAEGVAAAAHATVVIDWATLTNGHAGRMDGLFTGLLPRSEIHHHQHWEHGGETSLRNGYLLCSHHHHFLHRRPDWSVTFEDQTVRVFRPDGRELHADPWLE